MNTEISPSHPLIYYHAFGIDIIKVDSEGVTFVVKHSEGWERQVTIGDTKHLHRDIKRIISKQREIPIEQISIAFYFNRGVPRPLALPYPKPPRSKKNESK